MKNIFLFLVFLLNSSAFAGFGLLGGLNLSSPSQTGVNYSASSGYAAGLSYEIGLPGLVGIEIDALYLKSISKVGLSEFTVNSLQIPAIARLKIFPMFDFGGGVYYGTPTKKLFDQSDYGLVGSIRFSPLLVPGIKLVLDGRYCLGLNEFSGLKNRYLQALVGLSIGF